MRRLEVTGVALDFGLKLGERRWVEASHLKIRGISKTRFVQTAGKRLLRLCCTLARTVDHYLRALEGCILHRQVPLCLLALGTRPFECLRQGLQVFLGLSHGSGKCYKIT